MVSESAAGTVEVVLLASNQASPRVVTTPMTSSQIHCRRVVRDIGSLVRRAPPRTHAHQP